MQLGSHHRPDTVAEGTDAAAALPSETPHLRPAGSEDVAALATIETEAFHTDRLSPRSLRRLVRSETAEIIVAEVAGVSRGYAAILFRRGSMIARLYSIAVADVVRGQGVGEMLLRGAESAARARGAWALRLEVRADNDRAIALYRKLGYRQFRQLPDYYADHGDAVGFEKALALPDPGAMGA